MRPLDLKPDAKKLRQFGWIALVGFAAVALLIREQRFLSIDFGTARDAVAVAVAGLGVLSSVFSLVHPRANLPLYLTMSILTYPIGVVVAAAVLLVIFFLVLTPVGVLLRLTGRDTLQRRFEANRDTYWQDYEISSDPKSYFREY